MLIGLLLSSYSYSKRPQYIYICFRSSFCCFAYYFVCLFVGLFATFSRLTRKSSMLALLLACIVPILWDLLKNATGNALGLGLNCGIMVWIGWTLALDCKGLGYGACER